MTLAGAIPLSFTTAPWSFTASNKTSTGASISSRSAPLRPIGGARTWSACTAVPARSCLSTVRRRTKPHDSSATGLQLRIARPHSSTVRLDASDHRTRSPAPTDHQVCTFVTLALWFALSPSAAPAQPRGALPRVHLIATGGTISDRSDGRSTPDELVRTVPSLARYASVEAEAFANVASGALTVDDWLRLSRRINELLQAADAPAGIVVTSGTDTLEETAYFLHLTVRSPRPLVLVGSMRNPSMPGSDSTANLLDAVRVAADPTSRGRGALVVLNGEINAARDVTKTDAQRLQAFQSGDYGRLGVVDPDRIVYYREVTRRHTQRSEFDVASLTSLPRVDVLLAYQGAPGDLIQAAVDAGATGVVIAGLGAGSTSGTQPEGIAYAHTRGTVVVMSTRTGGGRVPPSQARPGAEAAQGGRSAPRLISAEDLSPVKARILLMLAVTRTKNPLEIQRMFTEY